MIDLAGIYIPFNTDVLSLTAHDDLLTQANLIDKTTRFRVSNILDICHLDDLKANAYDLRIINDTVQVSGLNVPFESLPSSFSGVALKVNHAPMMGLPHIQVKASPAKLAQGHNVWGWDDLKHGVHLILDTLLKCCPHLCKHLNMASAELRMLDINYSFKIGSKNEVMSVLDYLKTASYGQTKARKSEYDTVYFGQSDSKHKFIRIYYKLLELQDKAKSKKLQLTDSIDKIQLELIQDDFIVKFAENLLRVEAAIRKEWISKRFGSCHLYSVLGQCSPGVVSQMWVDAMSDISKAVGDVTFKNKSDDEIRQLINENYLVKRPKVNKHFILDEQGKFVYDENGDKTFFRYVATDERGNFLTTISYSNANNIYAFYRLILSEGYERVKNTISKTRFYKLVKQLEDVGIPRAHLQQYTDGYADQRSIIPFVKIIDMSNVVHAPHPLPDYEKLCDPNNIEYINHLFKIA